MVGVDKAGRGEFRKVPPHRHHPQVLGGKLNLCVEKGTGTRFRLSRVSHSLSFSFAGRLLCEGTLDILPRRGDSRRATDVESDDIDKQSSNGQDTEQQCLWEDNAKEGIQRIVSRPY